MSDSILTPAADYGLLLLHLSDIHFREPYCLNLEKDQEHRVRKMLINDIRDMVSELGNIDAIIVSGDIVHKSDPEEYKVAANWFSDVANAAGCLPSRIYTVPGNHDVNRSTARDRIVQGVRSTITCRDPGPDRDKELYDTLNEPRTGVELLSSMKEYSLFAAAYGCDLLPERPFWVEELPLGPGWTLKMHGLTTTLFSGPNDDVRGNLYLGALQRAFSPDDGVIRLAIMHHPPDWVADHDEFDDALWEGCAIHLIGHKHRQRYLSSSGKGVRLAAGAVNPARNEKNWEPGYNIINLKITKSGVSHTLNIKSHLRVWQTSPDRFVAKVNDDGDFIFTENIIVRQRPSQLAESTPQEKSHTKCISGIPENAVTSNFPAVGVENSEDEIEVPMESTSMRSLVFNFWSLSPSQRRKTMQDLNLLEEDDDNLPETLRYRLAFDRARKRGIIDNLNDVIVKLLAS